MQDKQLKAVMSYLGKKNVEKHLNTPEKLKARSELMLKARWGKKKEKKLSTPLT